MNRAVLKLLGLATGFILLLTWPIAFAEDEEKWEAPESASAVQNPVPANDSNLAQGKRIYEKRCVNCHGKTGQGDGPDAADLSVAPEKLSHPSITQETDGALFWKLKKGKKPMPQYGNRLCDEEIWQVINYLRTFGKDA